MKRLFYYSGFRLTVFHWDAGSIVSSYSFNPDKYGFSDFSNYLRSTDNTPVRILVDVIEESFSYERIPHVGNKDRNSLIKRMVEKKNRDSLGYYKCKIINREKMGRRDDNVLLSMLTNPSLLYPWLEIIEASEVPVSGIWSLPLITEKLVSDLKLTEGNVLVVSRQVPSNIRQSIYRDGCFKSSRTASINLYEADISEYISNEVEQCLRYFTNNRLIGFDEKVNVHIICNKKEKESIHLKCKNTPLVKFNFHDIAEIESLYIRNDNNSEYCNSLFSALCINLGSSSSHYGTESLLKYYYRKLASNALKIASVSIMLAAIVANISLFSEVEVLKDEMDLVIKKSDALEKIYIRNLQQIEPELNRSLAMKSTVMFYERLVDNKHINPQNYMIEVSRLLTGLGMHDVTISKIEWKRIQGDDRKQMPVDRKEKNDVIDYGDRSKIKHKATISGFVHGAAGNKVMALHKIKRIYNVFNDNNKFEKVNIIKMGMDYRPDKKLENNSGSVGNKESEDVRDGMFQIEMIMAG